MEFAKQHGIKLGSIADLIRYRSQNERLVRQVAVRPVATPYGEFDLHTYQDEFGGAHLALTYGQWTADEQVMVRVHEPLSLMDWLDTAQQPALLAAAGRAWARSRPRAGAWPCCSTPRSRPRT